MAALIKINEVLHKFANILTIVFLGAIAIVVPAEVINRYILGHMFTWSTEFCQYSFVWASLMGAASGLREGGQVAITSLMDKLSKPSARILQMVIYSIMIVFFAIMIFFGVMQVITNLNQTSSTLSISMSIPYASIPLGFSMMLLITLEQLLELLTRKNTGGK